MKLSIVHADRLKAAWDKAYRTSKSYRHRRVRLELDLIPTEQVVYSFREGVGCAILNLEIFSEEEKARILKYQAKGRSAPGQLWLSAWEAI